MVRAEREESGKKRRGIAHRRTVEPPAATACAILVRHTRDYTKPVKCDRVRRSGLPCSPYRPSAALEWRLEPPSSDRRERIPHCGGTGRNPFAARVPVVDR